MDNTHRIAVVGCGAISRLVHLPNIDANDRMKLAVTCDLDPAAAEQCRKTYGATRASKNFHDVVNDPEVDVILCATHTNLRSELIVPALVAGKPVYVEKPLANTLDEMLTILRATRLTGVPVCVGQNRRSSPAILDMKRLLEKAVQSQGGFLPSIDRSNGGQRETLPEEKQIQILMRVNDDCRSWMDWIYSDREGILFAEMVHFIDVALWLNPSHPVRVFAEGSARGNFTLLITFQDGSLTTIQHTLNGHFDYPKELYEISANHVTIAMDHHVELRQRGLADEPFCKTYPFKPSDDSPEIVGMDAYHQAITDTFELARDSDSQPAYISPNKGLAAHLDRFLDHIEGKGENPCSVVDAVVVTRVALKLLESARLGVPLPVGPEDWHVPQV